MTDTTRKSTPTPKMLDFATKIAQRKGEPLPAEVSADFDACKAYLDQNANTAPSEKALEYAQKISEKTGVAIPPDAIVSGKALSTWIDANK
jgi:hypothetical protein